MANMSQDQSFEPNVANRDAFLLLRWLMIILSGYLTVFASLAEEGITGSFLVVVAFVLSNVLLALMPLQLVLTLKKKHVVATIDAVFICAFLYYLRIDEVQIHLPFMGVVILAILWPDLRVVLFAMFVVSLLFGLLTNFQMFSAGIEVPTEDFLTLSLLFVVSIFYIFMVDRFDRDSETSAALLREIRNSENVTDIARRLSASLKANDVLTILVKRFREMMPDVSCSIVRVDSGSGVARVVAGSNQAGTKTLDFEDAPALNEAMVAKETSAVTVAANSSNGSGPLKTVAIPMISRDEVVALLYFEHSQNGVEMLDENLRFLEIVATTAANALANAEQFETLQELATSDSMTKLANHATFQSKLRHEVERARRHDRNVCLLMIDLDLLKNINDEYGHPVGDQVISAVADAIRTTCRAIDFGARYGGEEFAVILPETDLRSGVQVADRIRQHIADIKRFPTKISVSVGVANCPLDAASAEELIQSADNALYAAKGAGRNRVSPTAEEVANE
jgi:diguanylate cyclase (GGDEF)-like protein